MSSTDIQLYGNNAKSTLLLAIGPTDTVFSVASSHGSRFPTISTSNQYFLITLESAGVVEVCRVTSRVGDTLTVVRAQENTAASSFPTGAQIQMRVTRDTLAQMARLTDRLGDINSVDDLPPISQATGNSFLCRVTDDSGNPIIATKAYNRWRFPTHSTVAITTTITSSSTLHVASAAFAGLPVATGRYIVNFLTGALSGQSRLISAGSGNLLFWSTPTSAAPAVGIQVEILVSNGYQISLLSSVSDESIINAIIFGA